MPVGNGIRLMLAVVSLAGCAGGRSASGSSTDGAIGIQQHASTQPMVGRCMWAKTGGYHVCLIASAGRCGVFGDQCKPEPRE